MWRGRLGARRRSRQFSAEGIPLKQLGQPRAEVRGRVSVVTPTTASRARFLPQLWRCFVDQSWSDKELVVVETYHDVIMVGLYYVDKPSAFLGRIAPEDTREISLGTYGEVLPHWTFDEKRTHD